MYRKLLGLFIAIATMGFSYENPAIVRALFVLASEQYDVVNETLGEIGMESEFQSSAKEAFSQFESILAIAKPNSPAYLSSLWKATILGFLLDESYNVKTARFLKRIILNDPAIVTFGLQLLSRFVAGHVEWNLQEEVLTLESAVTEFTNKGVDFSEFDLDETCLQFVVSGKEATREALDSLLEEELEVELELLDLEEEYED